MPAAIGFWVWLFTALQSTDSPKTTDLFLFAPLPSCNLTGIANILFLEVIFCTESGV